MRIIGTRSLSSFIAVGLEVCWYAAGAFLTLMVCLLFVTPWVDPPRVEIGLAVPVALSVNTEVYPVADGTSGAEHVFLKTGRAELYFSPRNKVLAAAGLGSIIAATAFAMFGLAQLRGVFRTLRDGKPFVASNAVRLRRLGWGFVLGAALWSAAAYLGSAYASAHFAAAGVRFDTRADLNIVVIACGLTVVVIAEVFREGTRLDDEQSLTV